MCNCCAMHNNKSLDEIINQFKDVEGGLIPALHAIDAEYRYIPEEALVKLADAFKMPVSEVYGIVTFYAKFSIKKRGRNIIRVCINAPCYMAGSLDILKAFEKELGIKAGETTKDGKFTLETTQCFGTCHGAPAVTINEKPITNITIEKIPEILAQF